MTRFCRCGHGPGFLHSGDRAVVDAFKLWFATRANPTPWQPGDDIAIQTAGGGVERARPLPGQPPAAGPVALVVVRPDTGASLTSPLDCPRRLILSPWDDTFRPFTHAVTGVPLPGTLTLEDST
jgi:hypothetical protein